MPAALETLVLDGSIALFAVAFLVTEAAILLALARRQASPLLPILANSAAGLCLILAVHAALRGSGAGALALWLGFGGLAHLVDLGFRLRR